MFLTTRLRSLALIVCAKTDLPLKTNLEVESFYIIESLACTRKPELENSNIETSWCEIQLPNSAPFLVCTIYRPPSMSAVWIDLFEEELSIAQTTGHEIIFIGDFNID